MSSSPVALALNTTTGNASVGGSFILSFLNKLLTLCDGDVAKANESAARIGDFIATRLHLAPETFTHLPGELTPVQKNDLANGLFPASLLKDGLLDPAIAPALHEILAGSSDTVILKIVTNFIMATQTQGGDGKFPMLTGLNGDAPLISSEFSPANYRNRIFRAELDSAIPWLRNLIQRNLKPTESSLAYAGFNIVTLLNNLIKLNQEPAQTQLQD